MKTKKEAVNDERAIVPCLKALQYYSCGEIQTKLGLTYDAPYDKIEHIVVQYDIKYPRHFICKALN